MFERIKNKVIPTPSGSSLKIRYTIQYKGNNKALIPVEEIDIQKEINSHEEMCSLKYYLQKLGVSPFAREQIANRLNKQGVYADTTVFPKDFIDAQEQSDRIKNFVNSLEFKPETPKTETSKTETSKTETTEVNKDV